MESTMRQITFANQANFEKYGRKSWREQFLESMDSIIPWQELQDLVEPYYPKAGNGRQPIGLSIMLRVYFLQHWFNLSDPGAEDALYESPAKRRSACPNCAACWPTCDGPQSTALSISWTGPGGGENTSSMLKICHYKKRGPTPSLLYLQL
jgi:hypothetical protein